MLSGVCACNTCIRAGMTSKYDNQYVILARDVSAHGCVERRVHLNINIVCMQYSTYTYLHDARIGRQAADPVQQPDQLRQDRVGRIQRQQHAQSLHNHHQRFFELLELFQVPAPPDIWCIFT